MKPYGAKPSPFDSDPPEESRRARVKREGEREIDAQSSPTSTWTEQDMTDYLLRRWRGLLARLAR